MTEALARGVLALLIFASLRPEVSAAPYSYRPPDGYIPDAKTACSVAEAVWVPIYGQKQIDSEKPFHATLKKGIWTVEGHDNLPRGDFGGTALIEISKEDGRIIRVSHGM